MAMIEVSRENIIPQVTAWKKHFNEVIEAELDVLTDRVIAKHAKPQSLLNRFAFGADPVVILNRDLIRIEQRNTYEFYLIEAKYEARRAQLNAITSLLDVLDPQIDYLLIDASEAWVLTFGY